jgi:hypothetical protein
MPNPIRIQAADGSIVDLGKQRRKLIAGFPLLLSNQVAILNALEAALSMPEAPITYGDLIERGAWNDAIKSLRQAARVVEE